MKNVSRFVQCAWSTAPQTSSKNTKVAKAAILEKRFQVGYLNLPSPGLQNSELVFNGVLRFRLFQPARKKIEAERSAQKHDDLGLAKLT